MGFIERHKKYLTKAAIIWAAGLVLLAVAYGMLLRPQRIDEKRLDKQLTEKEQLYESAQRAGRQATRTRLNGQIKQLRSRLRNFVSNFEESANLTFDVGQIASQEKVASFSVKGKEKHATSTVPDCNCIHESYMDISFISGFYQFATFVNALERHKPVLFVNEFTLTRSNQDKSVYEATLDVAALVKKPTDTATAEKPAPPVLNAKT